MTCHPQPNWMADTSLGQAHVLLLLSIPWAECDGLPPGWRNANAHEKSANS